MKETKLKLLLIFTLIIAFCLASPLSAQELKKPEVGIDGLIIDRAQTKAGHEFYQDFVSIFDTPPQAEGANIIIAEKPNPIWGSWISVEVNSLAIFKVLIKTRSNEIRDMARKGTEVTLNYLYALRNGLINDESEISGDGIR